MTNALDHFPPDLEAAQARLRRFVPNAGTDYARFRNFDKGPGKHENVSVLSPYLRVRLLDETQVTRAVLAHHSRADAEKFLMEVFWRTYWKGWMELRPTVWDSYLIDLGRLKNEIQTQSGLRQRWQTACSGDTGIAPFDDWAKELTQTGYMHNHARMWFASIWIFTLGLPWQLGADFFLRHLLDGDVAVNTLSWRWVAGIQTPGKTYLARSDNIAKFTAGRYLHTDGLAPYANAIPAPEHPAAKELAPCPPRPLQAPYGVLTHGEDVMLSSDVAPAPVATAYAEVAAGHSPWHMAPHVAAFRIGAAQSAARNPDLVSLSSAETLAAWAAQNNLAQIVTPYAPVGPVRSLFEAYQKLPDAVPIYEYRRDMDSLAWPHATKGFFVFRKQIPRLIEACFQPQLSLLG